MSKNNYFVLCIALASILSLHPSPAFAAPSPAASSSGATNSSDETITENLKKRLQESLTPDTTPSVSPTYQSVVGIIRDVIKDTLVVEDKDGKKKILISDNTTLVRSPGNASIKPDSIRIEDYLIAIGKAIETDELSAVRLIVSTNPLTTTTKKSELAKITKITKTTLTLTPANANDPISLSTTVKTVIKSSLGESLELSDLSIGDSLIYTATETKDTLTATNIMRIGFADPDASNSPSPDSN